ncbi:disulfide bond formation protein B [Pseudomonas cichorii]|uniref:disulfide bond formation protein B n=1 Tax=Pseudomonas cichorii TaxID=36746 RepID=UPI000EFFE0F3|nr:disulfide bond formation protein B [Pseudomonas cichorii]
MHLARTRSLFFLAFIASALILGTAIYLQKAFGLPPCALCFFQRAIIIGCGLLCLVAFIHAPQAAGWRRYCVFLLLLALLGALGAGIQIWLQTASAEELAPIFNRYEHLLDALSRDGGNERLRSDAYVCAEINWSLFGITLPEWSLLAFLILGFLALYPLFSELRRWMSPGGNEGY